MTLRRSCCIVLALTCVCVAETPREQFSERYGEKIKAVAKTSMTTDDLALGKELYHAVAVEENLELMEIMAKASYGLCIKHPDGFELAVNSMLVLAELVEAKRIDSLEKALAVQQQKYVRAKGAERMKSAPRYLLILGKLVDATVEAEKMRDALKYSNQAITFAHTIRSSELEAWQKRAEEIKQTELSVHKVAALATRLEREPTNVELRRELILMTVGVIGNPQRAHGLLTASVDEELRSMVTLATIPINQMESASALELAQWYERLLPTVPKSSVKRIEHDLFSLYSRAMVDLPKHDVDASKIKSTLDRLRSVQKTADYVAWVARPRIIAKADPRRRGIKAKATKFLWAQQGADGTWNPGRNPRRVGVYTSTSLVVLTLLDSGVQPTDKRIAPVIEKIIATPHSDTLYNASSILMLLRAGKMSDPKGAAVIRQRVRRLLLSTADSTFAKESTGQYRTYRGDLYTSFWACWAISAAHDAGIEVSDTFYTKLWGRCHAMQHEDGGWGYAKFSSPSHVPTVMQTLLAMIAVEKQGKSLKKTQAYSTIRNGLDWIDENFDDGNNDDPMMYLFLLSRFGLSQNSTTINGKDWIEYMTDPLVKFQEADGSWAPAEKSPVLSTALGLMAIQAAR
ncbi:MAG: hypothetical protein HN909_09190 [Phycisphaerales bacterium]|jgi:hypothetical protein|nr:hypothetical protein [Phycisphaerales bacterium]MBT7171924.1 hypothetical protein [Phycisphaerales bacterium]